MTYALTTATIPNMPSNKREDDQLLLAYQGGNIAAGTELVSRYLLSARKFVAKQYYYRVKTTEEREDLDQQAVLGLFDAAKRHDVSRDLRFLTYARWRIMARVERYIQQNRQTVNPKPAAQIKVNKALNDIKRETHNQEIPFSELAQAIAERAEIQENTAIGVLTWLTKHHTRLDRPLIDDGTMTRLDALADSTEPFDRTLSRSRAFHELRAAVWSIVDTLNERTRDIIIRRWLKDDDETETLEQIGQSYNLSRERIRQIEAAAFKKIRERLERIESFPELMEAVGRPIQSAAKAKQNKWGNKWNPKWNSLLGTMSDKQVANRTGANWQMVFNRRKTLEIPAWGRRKKNG